MKKLNLVGLIMRFNQEGAYGSTMAHATTGVLEMAYTDWTHELGNDITVNESDDDTTAEDNLSDFYNAYCFDNPKNFADIYGITLLEGTPQQQMEQIIGYIRQSDDLNYVDNDDDNVVFYVADKSQNEG